MTRDQSVVRLDLICMQPLLVSAAARFLAYVGSDVSLMSWCHRCGYFAYLHVSRDRLLVDKVGW